MTHIHINTSDLRWAISFAGAAASAKNPKYSSINKPFSISFERTTPEIAYLADHFAAKPKGVEDYHIPANLKEYEFLDYFSAYNHQMELQEQHGIVQDIMLQPLNLSALASNSLLFTHGIISKPDYYYPKPSLKETRNFDYDIVSSDEHFSPYAESFLKGFDIEDPKILEAKTISMDAIKALASMSCKVCVAEPNDPLFHVLRSWYGGYDKIKDSIPVLSMIKDTLESTDRAICSWSTHIPVFQSETVESVKTKGVAWKHRALYNFDHHAYAKEMAKQNRKLISAS